MPVYNTKTEYLKEAIESILNQTYKDFELIVLNDGSVNNSEKIILSYNDERIKYFKNETNLGLPKTRNKLLDLATGEYIAYMDSDDISDKTRLEKQIFFLENNPNIDIVGTDCAKFPKFRLTQYYTDSQTIKNSFLFENCAICSASAMIKKSTLDRSRVKYDDKIANAEDYAFWLDLIDFANFSNIPEPLYNYRWHKKNVSKSGTFLQSLNSQLVMVRAQGKYFNVDSLEALAMIEKLKNKQKIASNELKSFENFVNMINLKMKENDINCEYNLNRNFYKIALKNCKRDFQFLKILWNSELNNLAQIRNWTKIENTLRLY